MTEPANDVPAAEPVPPPVPAPADTHWPAWLAWVPPAYRAWLMSLAAALLLALVGMAWRYFGLPGQPPPAPLNDQPAEVVHVDDGPVFGLLPGEDEPEITIRADQLGQARDWGVAFLGLKALHTQGHDGAGVVVAVLDTGVDADHPDLRDRLADGAKDFTDSPTGTADVQGHGTHVAGIVAQAAPGAKVLNVKVLGDDGRGSSAGIAAGIRYAADRANIISLSLGGPSPDRRTREAIDYAIARGRWVVAAAGNDGKVADSFPGHYPSTAAVAAVGKDGQRASFSTINEQNDVSAPGVSILSARPGGKYATMSGTSMATPYVAGSLAVFHGAMRKAGKPVPPQPELIGLLAKHSRDIDPAGHDAETGHGLVQPAKLLTALVGTRPPPPPPPPAKLSIEVQLDPEKVAEALRKAGWVVTPPGK